MNYLTKFQQQFVKTHCGFDCVPNTIFQAMQKYFLRLSPFQNILANLDGMILK